MRVHAPKSLAASLPCLVYYHGGGFVVSGPVQGHVFAAALVTTSVTMRIRPVWCFSHIGGVLAMVTSIASSAGTLAS